MIGEEQNGFLNITKIFSYVLNEKMKFIYGFILLTPVGTSKELEYVVMGLGLGNY